MQVRVLGPLHLEDAGVPILIGGARQRAVLALLLLHANEVVPSEQLLIGLWGPDAPPSAANALQAAVSRLRRLLPPGRLSTQPPGYLLRVFRVEVDARRFEELAFEGREALQAGDADAAARTLRQALALWQGPALADFRYEPFAQAEIARLEELQRACLEDRIEADLAAGQTGELVGELRTLVGEYPVRERLRRQLMLALYRSGRQAEALEVFRDLRTVMIEELGLEPSPALVELETSILRHDPALLRSSARRTPMLARRPVTVLCAVVKIASASGAAMDPETYDAIHARAASVLATVLDRYGGRLAVTAGERIIGVFGVTSVHEDDALRAGRASLEAREGLEAEASSLLDRHGVRLGYSFGLATGEALVGGPDTRGFVGEPGGGAVTLAEAAQPGQILISRKTYTLAAGALEVESAGTDGNDQLSLRSARDGVRALALHLDVPLTGRDGEIDELQTTFELALERHHTMLVTVLGEAGLGKSRLAHELVTRLGPAARVLTGRCLPYGEGITFWPIREVIAQACAGPDRVRTIGELLEGEPQASTIAERLTQAVDSGDLGRSDGTEISWAARRFLETVARTGPLLVIFEDLHWGEPTFLDLVESIAIQPGPSALVLLCIARPELLELRPAWASGAAHAITIDLAPLSDPNAAALLDALAASQKLPRATQAGILETAGGNPLYLEQLAISFTEQPWPDARPEMPPTIQALLAARLDRLGPGERQVLTCAAIVGQRFGLRSLTAMLPPEALGPLSRQLQALIAKGLVHDAQGDPEEPEAYSFRHILIQQATYRAIPKTLRAELHERFAGWLEQIVGNSPTRWEEILGYHFEQAARYVDELIGADEQARSLAHRAAGHLETAGRSALDRGDALAAVNLLERAGALEPSSGVTRPRILTALGMALAEAGRFDEAATTLKQAQHLAAAQRDEVQQAHARIQALFLGLKVDLGPAAAQITNSLPHLRDVFDRAGDELGRCRVLRLEAAVHWYQARSAAAEEAWLAAVGHARRSGDGGDVAEILGWLASAALWGPTPAAEGIRRCEAYLDEIGNRPAGRAVILLHLAGLLAMQDRVAQANEMLGTATAILHGLGPTMTGVITQPAAFIAMLTDDPTTAEEYLRTEYTSLDSMGEKGYLATSAALLAEAIAAQGDGRDDEVQRLIATSRAAGAGEDSSAQIIGDGVLARILAAQGRFAEAEELARSAVALAAQTDLISQHADALLDLAYVHAANGQFGPARTAREQALALHQRKGNLPGTRRSLRS